MATSIRLAPEIEQRLDYLAFQTGRTKAYYLREIIEQGVGLHVDDLSRPNPPNATLNH